MGGSMGRGINRPVTDKGEDEEDEDDDDSEDDSMEEGEDGEVKPNMSSSNMRGQPGMRSRAPAQGIRGRGSMGPMGRGISRPGEEGEVSPNMPPSGIRGQRGVRSRVPTQGIRGQGSMGRGINSPVTDKGEDK